LASHQPRKTTGVWLITYKKASGQSAKVRELVVSQASFLPESTCGCIRTLSLRYTIEKVLANALLVTAVR